MKKVFMLSIVFVLFFGVAITSCGDDSSSPSATCIDTELGESCGDIESCCTNSGNCYYKYNGKKYNCDGSDCTSAAEAVIADACDFGRLDVGAKEAMVQGLINSTLQILE